MDYEDIVGPAGTDNSAGIQTHVYFIDQRDVATHPTFPKIETSTTLAELVTVDDNIVLKALKKAFSVEVTLEAGAGTSDSQGEIDGMSFKNGLKFLVAGNKANSDGFARLAKNGSFYVVYAELDGTIRLLGTPGYPAKMMSAPGTTGEKTSDRKSRTFTFQSVWSGPAPIWTGKVMVGVVEQVLVFLA